MTPAGVGIPPAVRKRERSVSVWSRSASSPRFPAVTSKASAMVCRCGGGRMPAWYTPWNGTAGSSPCGSADPAAGDCVGRGGRRRPHVPGHAHGRPYGAGAKHPAQERPAARPPGAAGETDSRPYRGRGSGQRWTAVSGRLVVAHGTSLSCSNMTGIGESSSTVCPAAASSCSRWVVVRSLAGVQPRLVFSASMRRWS